MKKQNEVAKSKESILLVNIVYKLKFDPFSSRITISH